MKKLICYGLINLLFVINSTLNAQSEPPLLKKVNPGKSKFHLSAAKILISKDTPEDNLKMIDLFIGLVKQQTGIILSKTFVIDQSAPLIILNTEKSGSDLPLPGEKQGKQSREAYQINISAKKVQITANSNAAAFYALQTVQQLIKTDGDDVFIQEADIEDYPAFAYRSVMMDFSHGGLLTEEEIKNQINFLSRWKMKPVLLLQRSEH